MSNGNNDKLRGYAAVEAGRTPYETTVMVIPASGVRDFPYLTRFIAILDASNTSAVEISFNGASFSKIVPGIKPFNFQASSIRIRNTDAGTNTITIAYGNCDFEDNRTLPSTGVQPVSIADGADVAEGATSDVPATPANAASPWSVVSLLKGILAWFVAGQKNMAESLPVVLASDQSPLEVNVNPGGSSVNMNVAEFGGTAMTIGQQDAADSIPVVLANDVGIKKANSFVHSGQFDSSTQTLKLSNLAEFAGAVAFRFEVQKNIIVATPPVVGIIRVDNQSSNSSIFHFIHSGSLNKEAIFPVIFRKSNEFEIFCSGLGVGETVDFWVEIFYEMPGLEGPHFIDDTQNLDPNTLNDTGDRLVSDEKSSAFLLFDSGNATTPCTIALMALLPSGYGVEIDSAATVANTTTTLDGTIPPGAIAIYAQVKVAGTAQTLNSLQLGAR